MKRKLVAVLAGMILVFGTGCQSSPSKSGGCACSHEGASACTCAHCKGSSAICSCPR
ncbi:MAG TPA: hypothetical protein VG457_10830 [Planctomycetota bacterium]|nr:hypothetical protein [Planctomycetota bacterium]